MRVGPGETLIARWGVIRIEELVERLLRSGSGKNRSPRFIAVDGRSGGGKSTLAERLQRRIPHSTIIHTDDIAWHHSFFDWSDLLINGILRPVQEDGTVAYRPSAWEKRGRQGAILVPKGCTVVLIEGVGASRDEVRPWLTASVWIQSDTDEAESRGIARDGGTEEAKRFWMDWMSQENAFLERHRPWAHATAIVNGTPDVAHDIEREVVVAECMAAGSAYPSRQ